MDKRQIGQIGQRINGRWYSTEKADLLASRQNQPRREPLSVSFIAQTIANMSNEELGSIVRGFYIRDEDLYQTEEGEFFLCVTSKHSGNIQLMTEEEANAWLEGERCCP